VLRRALLFVALVVPTACTTVPPVTPLPAGDPRPAALIAQWDRSAAGRHAMRGRAHLAVDGDVRIRADQIVVLERPARLRVEVLGLLNQTAAVIATDGERFEVFRSRERSYQAGPVHPGLLWQEAHLALTPEEAVSVLLGALVLGPACRPVRAAAIGDRRVRVDLVDAQQELRGRAVFDAAGRLRELATFDGTGAPRWTARFDDYAPVSGVPFAHRIALDVAAGNSRAEITLRDVELNPELPAGIFQLRPPLAQGPSERSGG
jgi:hypothetical protein